MKSLKLRAVKVSIDANTGKEEIDTCEFGLWPVTYPLDSDYVIASYKDKITGTYINYIESFAGDHKGKKHLSDLKKFFKGCKVAGYTPQWYESLFH